MRVFLRLRRADLRQRHVAAGLPLRAVFFALVIGAMVLAIHQSRRPDSEATNDRSMAIAEDPLVIELARCRTVTAEQNVSDDTCRRVWAENRRRFVAPLSTSPNPTASELFGVVPAKDQARHPSLVVQPSQGEVHE